MWGQKVHHKGRGRPKSVDYVFFMYHSSRVMNNLYGTQHCKTLGQKIVTMRSFYRHVQSTGKDVIENILLHDISEWSMDLFESEMKPTTVSSYTSSVVNDLFLLDRWDKSMGFAQTKTVDIMCRRINQLATQYTVSKAPMLYKRMLEQLPVEDQELLQLWVSSGMRKDSMGATNVVSMCELGADSKAQGGGRRLEC